VSSQLSRRVTTPVSVRRRATLASHGAVVGAAVLFGSTFVPVKHAVATAGPVPFLAVRFLAGALMLWPFARRRPARPGEVAAALRCGVPLLAGYLLQTWGLRYTTASVSAFLTYLLVVLVPVITAVTGRRLPSRPVAAGVAVCTVGLYLLTGHRFSIGLGEALTLGCALAFAVNIIAIDREVAVHDPVRLAAGQLAVVGAGCLVPGFFAGGYRLSAGVVGAALYTALGASAIAFGLQVWGQRRVGPTRTSLLLMVEPVTAALIGWAFGDRLGPAGWAGAALILAGIAVAEVPAALDRTVNTGEACG